MFETVEPGHLQPHFTPFGAHDVSPFSRRRDMVVSKKSAGMSVAANFRNKQKTPSGLAGRGLKKTMAQGTTKKLSIAKCSPPPS
jgi:hypothetical protein